MISTLSPAAQSFLTGLDAIQQRAQRAQLQLTTGMKINNVSDAPDSIANLWQTRSNLDMVQQIQSNLDRVQTEVNTAESVLQSAVTIMERAQTLGTQGANALTDASTRKNLADELGSILQQLVSTANTTVEGRYIFSGDSDQQAPYTIDLTQANPVSAYLGSPSTRQIQAPDGSLFTVGATAQQVFDSANAQQSVFGSVNSLRQALLDNDDQAILAAIGDVTSANSYLNQQLAYYGSIQNRVQSSLDFSQNYETQLKAQLSGIQDADEAESITELTQAQTQLQAALVSRAQLPRTSLFDFLA
jgi:flagellar hook-associated protein 3 FlgL